MNSSSIGDLAQSYLLRNRNASLKQDITRLTEELATGQATDVRQFLVGNYAFLTDVERKTEVLAGYAIANTEARQFTGAMQLALGHFGTQASTLSTSLLSAGTSTSGIAPDTMAAEARDTLKTMVSTLNGNFAGRQLFSGNATNQRPLIDADTILTDLSAAISGAATPADMIAQATLWFEDPGGFAASAYLGSSDAMTSFAVGEGERVTLDVRANDPDFFAALRGAAVAALASDAAFALTGLEQAELFSLSGQNMLVAQDKTVAVQARIGFAEARLDQTATRNAAEATSLSMARNALLEVDPFEAATRLEEAQFQLQSLYSVTVRMSQLSLVNYL